LQATVVTLHPHQINHIKNAANLVWQPGVNRDTDYMGVRVLAFLSVRCEIWYTEHGREISVKSHKGDDVFKVKRGNLRLWLGI
jgi:putative DNA primase/helicase